MRMEKITFDKRNYRRHDDKNKRIIRKSLEELGAGRSVVIDNEGSLIAGNGVYEQAQKLKMPVRVVETDGSELVVVKRTDLATGDEKRKRLALADNVASDLSDFDNDLLQEDFTIKELGDWGLEFQDEQQPASDQGGDGLPPELQGLDLTPDELQKIQGSDDVLKKRVIIVYDPVQEPAVAKLLGRDSVDKVVYNFDEL